ncbi:inositol monophosphatase family protein [Nocardioides alkalitolerans]|uniref:inositol monophosphatase family protein n=1 Tax=Nocardioides alkalitolerans TaxID=281714 RepID=UPI000424C1FD|nr:inositol monophosphatase family protein [Nocardioides alkalitolerans]
MSGPGAGTAPDGTPYATLRDVAVTVALEAADLVRTRRARGFEVAATKSSSIDVVTDVDRASEELLTALLAAARPDDGLLGEEGAAREGTSGVRWVVDPIDGTVNFLYGIPQYAVSVAAEVVDADGTPRSVAGAVVDVATGSVNEAYLGGGARRDGTTLRVRPDVTLDQRLVLTGFSYDADLRRLQAQALVHLLPRVRDIRRMGSCALDLCALAAGQADAYVEEGTHPWDHAAGTLVASEAGARWAFATGAGGREALVCGPAAGFDALWAAVAEAGYLTDPTPLRSGPTTRE